MKKRLTACLLILCTLFSVSSMAFAVPMTTELAIEATWMDAGDFSEGLARVFDGEKWGYIDTDGTVVIEPTWDIAGDFSEGLAAVALVESGEETQTPDKETWYFIDHNGEICYELGENNGYYYDTLPYVSGLSNGTYLIAPGGGSTYSLGSIRPDSPLPIESFSNGTAYKDGFAIVSAAAVGTFTRPDELERLVGVLGVEALPDMLVDLTGTVTWDTDWGVILAVDNGLVTYHSRTTGLWGIDTIDGKELVKAEIEDLVYRRTNGTYAVFSEGYATVVIDNIYYAVDTAGNLTKLEAAAVGRYSEGLFPYASEGLWGYMTAQGTVSIATAFTKATSFSEGVAVVATEDGYYYIDKSGKTLHDTAFDAAYAVSDGMGRVLVGDKYGYTAFSGTPVTAKGDEPSASWAAAPVAEAIEAGLVPNELCARYRMAATRADVVRLAITMLAKQKNCTIEELILATTGSSLEDAIAAYDFTDSADRYMVAANALGIINGFVDDSCKPDNTITRAEAAKILAITATLAGISADGAPLNFADSGEIRVWAKEYVDFVTATGIMNGTGNDKFSPFGTYTVEQAIVTMLRIYNQTK